MKYTLFYIDVLASYIQLVQILLYIHLLSRLLMYALHSDFVYIGFFGHCKIAFDTLKYHLL